MINWFRWFAYLIATLLLIFSSSISMGQQIAQRMLTHGKSDFIALVIGNAAYPQAPLQNSSNDAKAIAKLLKELGFQVNLALNVNLREMESAVDNFITNLKPGSVGLCYYAGHGIQIEGENYLIPIDFTMKDEADAKYSSYSASRLNERMEKAGTRLNIIILDACRNNPFLSTRSTSRGLAIMNSGQGTFIAFATAPGKTASDNTKGANGLFTSHLLEIIKEPSLSLEQVFSKVREKVASASNGKQIPWTSSSVIGEFYFNPLRLLSNMPPAAAPNTETVSPPGPSQMPAPSTVQKVVATDFTFALLSCRASGRSVIFQLTVTNNSSGDRAISLETPGTYPCRMFDEVGNEYIASEGQLGGDKGYRPRITLVPQVATKVTVKFDNVQSEATTVTLLRVSCYDWDNGAVPVADFRNIPITK